MPTKTNEACTLKTRQITKNPVLTLGQSQKDVDKYKKLAAVYGNIAPVIVAAPRNGEHLILEGSARLEACVQTGINEIPAVLSQTCGETEQLKLTLMLRAIRDESGALSEGAIISRLVNNHNTTPRELCSMLGKSKAWVSKRMSLAQNLAETVKRMITDGTLCPRSAEEVAKLPPDSQAEFASNVVNCGLNKTEISQLVRRYRNAHSENVRSEIVKSPLDALSKVSVRDRGERAENPGKSPGLRLASTANYAAQMLLKTVCLAENSGIEPLHTALAQLDRLSCIAGETELTLNRLLADVSPGKQSTKSPVSSQAGGEPL